VKPAAGAADAAAVDAVAAITGTECRSGKEQALTQQCDLAQWAAHKGFGSDLPARINQNKNGIGGWI